MEYFCGQFKSEFLDIYIYLRYKIKNMKSILFLSLLLFPFLNSDQDKSAGVVEQSEGKYVYIQSKPTSEYEVLGTVKKTGLVWSGKPKEMYRTILRRAQKDYPNCEAVIFEDIDMDHATCVKFKSTTDKNMARVEQAEGKYVFIQSKPVKEYEVLGTVKKTGLVWSGKPKEMYRTILRRAHKEYPNCDAVIFEDIDMDYATCVKFKN